MSRWSHRLFYHHPISNNYLYVVQIVMKLQINMKSEIIKTLAREQGFIGCGISKVQYLKEDATRLKTWLNNGMHGEMGYMNRYFEKRVDPGKLLPGARSVISVLMNYATRKQQKDPHAPIISKYAFGEDYHYVMKRKLKQLLTRIQSRVSPCEGRVFVDSAPVLERVWAARSGLGWIGKHSLLLNRTHGSFFFIGELILDMELACDSPAKDYCGNCTRCIDACPTRAIIEPHVVDARKCISYFTIEHKSKIPEQFREAFRNRVFGCDICQDVCPWNLNATPHEHKELEPDDNVLNNTRQDWYQITAEEYHRLFKNSAVKRSKYTGFRRNLDFIGSDVSPV